MPHHPSHDKSTLEERVYLERVRQFFGHAANNMGSVIVACSMSFVVLKGHGVPLTSLIPWLTATVIVSSAPWMVERSFRRASLTSAIAPSWVRKRIFTGAVVAFMLGIAGFLVPVGDDAIPLLFLMFIMTTLVSVAGIGYSTIPSYVRILAAATIGPMMIRLLMNPDTLHLILLAACAIWLVVYLRKAADVSRSAIQVIEANEHLKVEIERRKQAEEDIRYLAHHDPLTGIANRRYFEEHVERALARARRSEKRGALVVIDLDGFKPINDRHGHQVGDLLLTAVAMRLQQGLRETDFLARVGGDEFCVFMENLDDRHSLDRALEKMEALFAEPYDIDGTLLPIGASFGGALYPDDGIIPEALFIKADDRMYNAKRSRKKV